MSAFVPYTIPCPGPSIIRFYFGLMPTGCSVKVVVLGDPGVKFVEGTEQTISAVGTMDWTVQNGYGPSTTGIGGGSAAGYLPPAQLVPATHFGIKPSANMSIVDLLDALQFLWTALVIRTESC